jgi:hypothetical protein
MLGVPNIETSPIASACGVKRNGECIDWIATNDQISWKESSSYSLYLNRFLFLICIANVCWVPGSVKILHIGFFLCRLYCYDVAFDLSASLPIDVGGGLRSSPLHCRGRIKGRDMPVSWFNTALAVSWGRRRGPSDQGHGPLTRPRQRSGSMRSHRPWPLLLAAIAFSASVPRCWRPWPSAAAIPAWRWHRH